MITLNQKCNAFASIIGIFCYAHNTPEKLVEVLSRCGISISVTSTNVAAQSLSAEADNGIVDTAQSLVAAWAYDNFDMDFKTAKSTSENLSKTTLHHLTSGLLFRLPSCITPEDLKCSHWLWERSRLNDELADNRPELAPLPDWENVLAIHPQYRELDSNGMSCRDRFNAWKILHDLVHHGPVYFHRFRKSIGSPEVIDQTPLEKTRTIPARAMEVQNSTVSGNIEAVTNLLTQGRVGDSSEFEDEEAIEDVSEYVVLFHGDLGSGERLMQALMRRSLEETSFLRLQMVVFVFGLFHAKMAAADTIHRVLIKPLLARLDPNSVMRHVAILRPRETGKIVSSPGFRRMHQVIQYDGIARRLDALGTEIRQRNPNLASLDAYAKTEPKLEELKVLANHIAIKYVAKSTKLEKLRSPSATGRDIQYENNLVINQLYFLYEELTHAMNEGDIGRVEKCLEAWMFLFKAAGKHKYAAEIARHITNVHFFYPPGLKQAVRYSMLINPTGQPGKYRAVDWMVELNNLFIKVSLL